jgi:hypothetical protein
MEIGVPCPSVVRTGLNTDEAKRTYARELNCARRQMTEERKRPLVEAQLRDTPELSDRWIADIIGVSQVTVGCSREHLEKSGDIAHFERLKARDGKSYPSDQKPKYPWMHGVGWEDWHRMEARHYLKQMTDGEKEMLEEMIDATHPTPSDTVKLLGGLTRLSPSDRDKVQRLWQSSDSRDKDRAISTVAGVKPMADPRIALLLGAIDYAERAFKAFPSDPLAVEIKSSADEIRRLAREVERQRGE